MARTTNNWTENGQLALAVAGLTKLGHRNYKDLPKVLRDVAMSGKPADFQFNIYHIKYCTKDRVGAMCLHWVVTNGILGTQKIFRTKDFVGKTGKVLWGKLAKEMRLIVS